MPLRLVLTDYAGDPKAAAHGLGDAPWAVRLATQLLREVQLGAASQWAPYLQARSWGYAARVHTANPVCSG